MFKKIPQHLTVLVIFGLIILGFIWRCYHLDQPSLWMDESYTLNAALAILTKGYPVLDSGYKYWGAFPHSYLLAGIIKLFGLNLFFLRLPSVLAGGLFILIIYLITRQLFNRRIGLITAIFVTLSYWQIAWSRQIRMYIFVEIFAWLSIYFFWRLYKSQRLQDSLLSLLLLFLAAIFHPVALLLLPAYFVFWLIYFPGRQKWRWLLYLTLLPIIFEIFARLKLSSFDPILLISQNFSFQFYLPSFLEFFAYYWPIFSLLTIVGSIWFIINKKNNLALSFLLLIFFLPFIIFSFFFKNLIFRYLFIFTPAIFIISASFIEKIYLQIKSPALKIIFFLIVLLPLFLTKELIIIPQSFYALESNPPTSTKTYLSYTPQPDFAAAYNIIKSQIQPNQFVISAYPQFTKIYLNQPGYWLAFDYLGANNSARYILSNNQEIYAGAPVISNLEQLKKISSENETYIVFDQMARDRIDPTIIQYVEVNYKLIFKKETNRYSVIYVYSN